MSTLDHYVVQKRRPCTEIRRWVLWRCYADLPWELHRFDPRTPEPKDYMPPVETVEVIEAKVTEAMVDRALAGWHVGQPRHDDRSESDRRTDMRHALTMALGLDSRP